MKETGGDEYQAQREQWDDANNTVALARSVVVSYERNTFTITKMRQAGIEVIAMSANLSSQQAKADLVRQDIEGINKRLKEASFTVCRFS